LKTFTTQQIAIKEKINVITHGLGVLLSIIGTVLLIFKSVNIGNALQIISYSVFGASMILLYSSSTIYHATRKIRLKIKLNKLDHSSIYLLIAGTYTPFLFVTLKGAWGWTLFGIIWTMAIAGIIYKVFFYTIKYRKISAFLYWIMSLIIIIGIKPMFENLSSNGLIWLGIGGLFYSVGIIFYIRKDSLYSHNIWHLFVLGGTLSHFISIYFYV